MQQQESIVADDILTITELAEWLKVSTAWIYDHTSRAEPMIPHIRMGGHVRFHRGTVQKWLLDQQRAA
jgi:excisionase family DNA binding protein